VTAATAWVSIGSNIEPERHVRLAIRRLGEVHGELRLSSVYRSPAVGFAGADFLNLVAGFDTALTPAATVDGLEALHREAGRVRGTTAWVSRTLDLDLLLHGDTVSDSPRLPHPDILRYAFVLGPLAEVAPALRHPVSGATMQELWERFDRSAQPLVRVAGGRA
jgi:2-amino-4-hydroxy-6-hydroxymethyldihydropteridine diphosphokinase